MRSGTTLDLPRCSPAQAGGSAAEAAEEAAKGRPRDTEGLRGVPDATAALRMLRRMTAERAGM
eukprot:9130377-Alexandrium_andersonii.AAC.1